MEYTGVPHCIADGKTAGEAIRHGREALEACLVTIAESGRPIPAPGIQREQRAVASACPEEPPHASG